MIFRRALVAELSSNAGAVFTVLFSIVFSVGLVRILGEAAGGRVDGQVVFSLVALTALTWLPQLMVLTLFIAVLLTLSRAFRDSEMVVWFASGQSLLAWIRPVLRFALPVALGVAVLSLAVTPWANRQISESKLRFAKRDDVSRVAPGRFIESGNADRVFFVENVDVAGTTVRNIFVSHRSQGREGVIVAASGVIETRPDGERFLVLSEGRRYEGTPGQAEYRMVEFERYAIRLETRPAAPIQETTARNQDSGRLLRERSRFNDAELLWRIGLPVAAVMLALIAIPLAFVNPRVGRSANLIAAVFVFFLYLTTLQMMQAQVQLGRVPLHWAVWLPHAVAATVAAFMFVRRVFLQRWLPRWSRRAAAGAGA
jgi:lipopolysaccharide export system permease protein